MIKTGIILVFGVLCSGLNLLAATNYVVGCTIYNEKMEILRNYPANICVFFPNGNYLKSGTDGLSMRNSQNEPIWSMKGVFHHQINLSIDNKHILAMTSVIAKSEDEKVRYDKLVVIDLNGHLERAYDFSEHAQYLGKKLPGLWAPSGVEPVKWEMSHFNSFYEIPQNKIKSSSFKQGGYIANSLFFGIFVLDKELKNVLFHFSYNNAQDNYIHDVQVDKNGYLMIFNNKNAVGKNQDTYSSIDIFDPIEKKILYKFSSKPRQMFYSDYCGGVQRLENGEILFSDFRNRFYILNRKNEIKRYFETATIDGDGRFIMRPLQQVKQFDLTEFLKNNSGL